MNFKPLVAGCCTALLTVLLWRCSESSQVQTPPNIVWITSEDNSVHYLRLFDEHGVGTPHIQYLADNGLVFKQAFSNSPVCSVARSTLISGCYGPRTGAQFHRKIEKVPMPKPLKMFPSYLREAGYYTTNNSKEDYNYYKDQEAWDESSKEAHWRKRSPDQPFFHVFNIGVSHESGLHFEKMDSSSLQTRAATTFVLPNHPNTDLFRYTNAYYRDKIIEMDRRVGEVIEELQNDGLLENTIVFYFGDHGGVLPGSKGYIYETGLHVPLVIYVPPKYQDLVGLPTGSEIEEFVSFVDFAPTVLALAGVQIPAEMDGVPFFGTGASKQQVAFSYADRFDEKYDLVRAVRKDNFKYIRNYQPFNFDGLMNNYRYRQLAYQQWDSLYRAGSLNQEQAAFFEPKPAEALFNLNDDPYEIANLALDPDFQDVLNEMRATLVTWQKDLPDLSLYPEHYLIAEAFDNPVDFGNKNKLQIERYIDIANLCLSPFEEVRESLLESLRSPDPWDRYWALGASSSFREKAKEVVPVIVEISTEDSQLINRVKAAEFLGLINEQNPSQLMIEALYQTNTPAEALLILNSIALMSSHRYNYPFKINSDKMNQSVKENAEVIRRLEYLNVL